VFENLSEKLQNVLRNLKGEARVSEAVLAATLRELRMALLEADVHVGVVKALLDGLRAKALGEEVLRSLSPGQQVVKIVRDELALLLGGATPAELLDDPARLPELTAAAGSMRATYAV